MVDTKPSRNSGKAKYERGVEIHRLFQTSGPSASRGLLDARDEGMTIPLALSYLSAQARWLAHERERGKRA